jgi:putative NADH-flavin reductase
MECGMKLTIFAATGGIGRQLLDQAVGAGHDVTAVVRSPERLSGKPVRAVRADLANPDMAAIESAVAGADAVLSGLGPSRASDAGIAATGTRPIVQAMRATGVRRLVVVSAAPVSTMASPGRPNPPRHDPGDGPVMRYVFTPLIQTLLRKVYVDLAEMEDVLRDSGLDWTVVRPPRLSDKPLTGRYRTAYGQNLPGGRFVSRADVAHLMLRVLDQPETIHQAIGVAN